MSMSEGINSIEREAFERCAKPRKDVLHEYRCSCGRLLGRFSGRAEVKCPKCGKMNVIGVENLDDIKKTVLLSRVENHT